MPLIVIFIFQNTLNSDSGESWIVILAKSEKLAGIPESDKIRRTLFSDAMLPAPKLFSDEFRIKKKNSYHSHLCLSSNSRFLL